MRKWFKRLLMAAVLLAGLLAAVWYGREPILRQAAASWIVTQPISKADAIVVLGGGLDTRPFEAARLYRQGLAPRILVMNPRLSASTELGLQLSEAELTREILLKQQVPAEAIIVPVNLVTNSFDESITVRNWARTNGATKVIIPTDIFHTRRVRWLYDKEFNGTGIGVEIEAVSVRDYCASNWWHQEQGIIAFQNEVLKYAYYRLKY